MPIRKAIGGVVVIMGAFVLAGALIGGRSEPTEPVGVPAPRAAQPKVPAVPVATVATTAVAALERDPLPSAAVVEPNAGAAPQAEPLQQKPVPLKPASVPVRSTGGDRDCPDFGSQAEAQRFFLENGGPASDLHKLDRDNDGIACESR